MNGERLWNIKQSGYSGKPDAQAFSFSFDEVTTIYVPRRNYDNRNISRKFMYWEDMSKQRTKKGEESTLKTMVIDSFEDLGLKGWCWVLASFRGQNSPGRRGDVRVQHRESEKALVQRNVGRGPLRIVEKQTK